MTFSLNIVGQEICDNGIDDDNDGLIDLNDVEDCLCSSLLPSSLIPNPSFEDRTCCPSQNAQLDCAVGWIQASGPTTDYINTCGSYLGNPNASATVPLPLPDGTGAVGFRDGESGPGSDFKEYVGACLLEPMKVGVEYRLEFFVGFQDNKPGSKQIDIGVYASPNCSELPFGNGSNNDGCPTKWPTYQLLDIKSVSGSNEWVSVVFEFVPTQDLNVLVIGPSCTANPNIALSPYFFIDGLTVAESSSFGVPLEDAVGSICNDDLVLSINDEDAISYQWYKDGIALVGETAKELGLINHPDVAGSYQVILNYENSCISSKTFYVRVPPYFADFETNICEGDEFIIGTESWDTSGEFVTTIAANDGCDSIITLVLDVNPTTYGSVQDIFCEGDEYSFLDITAETGGSYQTTIPNNSGCDSLITLELEEIPATEGISLEESLEIELGDIIDITPDYVDPLLIDFTWTNDKEEVVGNDPILSEIRPLNSGSYSIQGLDQYGCGVKEQIQIRVDKSNTTIYAPNIFSPDGNNINDYFNIKSSQSLTSIDKLVIFDRWGNKVHLQRNVTDIANFKGWDGTVNNKDAEQGVYVWMIEATFLDGSNKVLSGDLTLIRI